MADVVDLAAFRAAEEPEEEIESANHLSGPAKCLACGHEWIAVAGVGDECFDLVCPKCDTRRGQRVYPANAPEGAATYTHKCGSQYYTIVFVDHQGFLIKDIALLNTAGRDVGTPMLLCTGCGDLVNPDGLL